jgi:toxin ParE1/3/4
LTKPVIFLPSAEADVDRLVDFVLEHHPAAALAIYQKLKDGILPLKRFPKLGRLGQITGTRELLLLPYVVVYRVRAEAIDILHIYHGAEDRMKDD